MILKGGSGCVELRRIRSGGHRTAGRTAEDMIDYFTNTMRLICTKSSVDCLTASVWYSTRHPESATVADEKQNCLSLAETGNLWGSASVFYVRRAGLLFYRYRQRNPSMHKMQ